MMGSSVSVSYTHLHLEFFCIRSDELYALRELILMLSQHVLGQEGQNVGIVAENIGSLVHFLPNPIDLFSIFRRGKILENGAACFLQSIEDLMVEA